MKLRNKQQIKKKVLITGLPGSGKSTYADKYCKENKLNPLIIDIDETNFTDNDVVDIDTTNDRLVVKSITDIIKEANDNTKYNTIIIDGLSNLMELLTSNANGMKKWADRATNFSKILRAVRKSDLNVIWIGQNDFTTPIISEEYQSPKPVIGIHSLVNETYECVNDGKKFDVITKKIRS